MIKLFRIFAYFILLALLILSYPVMRWAWLSSEQTRINAIASLAVALATLFLATVAFVQILESREQIRRAEYASLRPLLVPDTSFDNEQLHDNEIVQIFFDVRNVGSGVATNVWGVILPLPESETITTNQWCARPDNPLAANDPSRLVFSKGTIFGQNDRIDGVSLVPQKILSPNSPLVRDDRYAARLTLTYSDVFGLKHAAFFDLTTNNKWVCFAVRNEISKDLSDLNSKKSIYAQSRLV